MATHVIMGRIVGVVVVLGGRLALFMLVALVLPGAGGGCANDQKVMAVADTMHHGLTPAVMEDPELQGYLQKIGERIVQTAAAMDKEGFGPKSHTSEDNAWMFSDRMRFYLVSSKQLNAFTTGADYMYV